MRFVTASLASVAAIAIAGGLSLSAAQALPKPGAPAVGKTVQVVKGKKRVAAYKSCGTYMYRKGGKCLDARQKK